MVFLLVLPNSVDFTAVENSRYVQRCLLCVSFPLTVWILIHCPLRQFSNFNSVRLTKVVAEMQIPEPLLTQGSQSKFEDLLSPEAYLMVLTCIALDSNLKTCGKTM